MKSNKNEVRVSLKIHDFECDPSEITAILGINSTENWKRGEKLSPFQQYKSNGWVYKIVQKNVKCVGEMIDDLVATFSAKVASFEKIPKNSYIEISIVCFLKKGRPWFFFSKENLDFIHKIGAEIDFDLYQI
jgi:hypothetical protein